MLMVHIRYAGITVVYLSSEHLWFNTSEKTTSCLLSFLLTTLVFLLNNSRSQCILVKLTCHHQTIFFAMVNSCRTGGVCIRALPKTWLDFVYPLPFLSHYDLVISHARL